MNAKMIMTMDKRRYMKHINEAIDFKMSGRILVMSGLEDDYWGYAPGRNPADVDKLA